MRKLLVIAIVLIAHNVHATGTWSGIVTKISDGDTLWIKPAPDQRPAKVRLQGIDAPEICQAWGAEARDALAQRVLRRRVTINTRRNDDYGRALARIDLDGEDVAGWMVQQGHAWSYRYRRDEGPYAAQQTAARAARRGLFADSQAERPRDFRQRHGPCALPVARASR